MFGFTIGNVYMMQSLITSEIFGMVSFGSVFGLIMLAGQAGSGLGPVFVGLLEDATGSYTSAFVVTAGLTYLAAGAILLAKPIEPPAGATHEVDRARDLRGEAAGG
jgi:MFS family permease